MTTTQIEVTKTTSISEGREQFDFNLTDKTKAKKRVGAKVSKKVMVVVNGLCEGYTERRLSCVHGHVRTYIEDGTWYCWLGNATRNGEWFGASQDWHYCATEAQRETEIAKYLKASEARARKAFSS